MLQFQLDRLPEGTQLRLARIAAGMTLWDLSVRANVSPPRLSEHERGRGVLPPDALARVRDVLASEIPSSVSEGDRALA